MAGDGIDESFSESEEISESLSVSDYETATSDVENIDADSLADRFTALKCKPEELELEDNRDVNDVLTRAKNEEDFSDEEEESEEQDESEDDDEGWITPGKYYYSLRPKKQ